MNDDASPSIVLPLIGTAACTLFLAVALGYCAMVDDEDCVFTDDDAVESGEQVQERPDSIALGNGR